MLRGRQFLTGRWASLSQAAPITSYTLAMPTGATSTDPSGATNTDPFAAGWITQTSYNERRFPNAAGAYQTYNSGTLSRNDMGVWHRDKHRNQLLKNNSMTGASAPSTVPTTWTETVAAPAGITRVVATGTDSTLNLPYLDLTFTGTALASAVYTLQFGANGDHGTIELKTAVVSAGGTGYAVNDIVTLANTGGTMDVSATVLVTAVSAGVITAVSILNPGAFSVAPTANPITQLSTTGVGTGATFTVTYGLMAALQLSAWLGVTGSLSRETNVRLEGIFTTSVGGASGASQTLDDRVLNRDTTPRRHRKAIVAPTPGTAALVKPSLQIQFTSGQVYSFTIRIVAPQLEPVAHIDDDCSQPIMTTSTAAFSRADSIVIAGDALSHMTTGKGTVEITTDKLTGDHLGYTVITNRIQDDLIRVNSTVSALKRAMNDGVTTGLVTGCKTYRSYRTCWGFEQQSAVAWGNGAAQVATTTNLQVANNTAGSLPTITSINIAADGCIKELILSNGKKSLGTYNIESKDVIVYGATSGGIAAAASVIDEGSTASVFMGYREVRPGAMSSGGLSAIDANDFAYFGGMSIDMLHYPNEIKGRTGSPTSTVDPTPFDMYRYFDYLIRTRQVRVYPTRPADNTLGGIVADSFNSITKRITAFTTAAGQIVSGTYFIDASYEGDLMAAVDVSYANGREARNTGTDANGAVIDGQNGNKGTQGGETDSFGYSLYQFQNGSNSSHTNILTVDPWTTAGDSTSARLPYIQDDLTGGEATEGAATSTVQAYNFRQALTTTASRKIDFSASAPTGYDEADYELLGRWAKACIDAGRSVVAWNASPSSSNYSLGNLFIFNGLDGNALYDLNNGNGFSSNMVGANWGALFQSITGSSASYYAEATNAEREIFWQKVKNYILGFWYYLQYDSANEVAAMSATINAGGTGYAIGDRIVCNVANTMYPVVARVSTVSSGAVTAVTIMGGVLERGFSDPANPISQSSTSGSGTGCTLNITWDSRIDSQIRNDALLFGLANDQFYDYCEDDFEGWMPQLYVREARRMIGLATMHSSDVLPPIGSSPIISTNTVGCLSYAVDSHHHRRYAVNRSGTWRTENEGNIVYSRSGFNSYAPIPLEVLLPTRAQCTNLGVSFCVSSSHPAFGAERMEMSHITLSESLGILFAQMVQGSSPDVQDFGYSAYRTVALARGLILPQTN